MRSSRSARWSTRTRSPNSRSVTERLSARRCWRSSGQPSVELSALVSPISPQCKGEKGNRVAAHVKPVGSDASAFRGRSDGVPDELSATVERQVRCNVLQEVRKKAQREEQA